MDRRASIPYPIFWIKFWEIGAEGKLCELGISNASSGPEQGGMKPEKAMVSALARCPVCLWNHEDWRRGTLGLDVFVLRKSLISLCNGMTSCSYCLCRGHEQWVEHPMVVEEVDKDLHDVPMAIFRTTWRTSQEGWELMWTGSLKLLGLSGHLLYFRTTKAWASGL